MWVGVRYHAFIYFSKNLRFVETYTGCWIGKAGGNFKYYHASPRGVKNALLKCFKTFYLLTKNVFIKRYNTSKELKTTIEKWIFQ